jgi:SAM-dependent methyltransferase
MSLLFIIFILLVIAFGFVVLYGAPYLPTLGRQTETALDLLDLKPGQTLLELGSGDGRVLVAAARRGLNVTGYELNPVLALFSWARTRKYRAQIKVVWGNYWRKDWPLTDGIFVFLLDKYMERLDTNIVQKYPGHQVKLVSFAFEIPNKKPIKAKQGLFLYAYGD